MNKLRLNIKQDTEKMDIFYTNNTNDEIEQQIFVDIAKDRIKQLILDSSLTNRQVETKIRDLDSNSDVEIYSGIINGVNVVITPDKQSCTAIIFTDSECNLQRFRFGQQDILKNYTYGDLVGKHILIVRNNIRDDSPDYGRIYENK